MRKSRYNTPNQPSKRSRRSERRSRRRSRRKEKKKIPKEDKFLSRVFGLSIIRYRKYVQLPENETFETLPNLVMKDLSLVHRFIMIEFSKSHRSIQPAMKKFFHLSKRCYSLTHHLLTHLREDAEINRCGTEDLEPMTKTIKRFFSRYRGLFLVTIHLLIDMKRTLSKLRRFREESKSSSEKGYEPYKRKMEELSSKMRNYLKIYQDSLRIETLHREDHIRKYGKYRRCYGFVFASEFDLVSNASKNVMGPVFQYFNCLHWDRTANLANEGVIRFFAAYYNYIKHLGTVPTRKYDPSDTLNPGRAIVLELSKLKLLKLLLSEKQLSPSVVSNIMVEYLTRDKGQYFLNTAIPFLNLSEDPLITRMKTEWPSLSVPVSTLIQVPIPSIFESEKKKKKEIVMEEEKESININKKIARDGCVKLSDFMYFANHILKKTKLTGRFRIVHVRLVCPYEIEPSLSKKSSYHQFEKNNFSLSVSQVEDFSKIKRFKRRFSSTSSSSNPLSFLSSSECLSSTIIFYVHGGGYVGGSSHSSEPFIRWVSLISKCPVFSIEYHCCPVTRYPIIPLQVFIGYRFVIQHASTILKKKVNRVFIMGDSAGGGISTCLVNLCIATSREFHNTLLLQKRKRKRRSFLDLGTKIPDGLILFYPSLFIAGFGSPSRILSYQDPILSPQFLGLCLQNYPHPLMMKKSILLADPFISPILTPRKIIPFFPPTYISTTPFCPLFDEGVYFAKKLDRLNVGMVRLSVLEGIHHGWVTSSDGEPEKEFPKECSDEVKQIIQWMKLINTKFIKRGGRGYFRQRRKNEVQKQMRKLESGSQNVLNLSTKSELRRLKLEKIREVENNQEEKERRRSSRRSRKKKKKKKRIIEEEEEEDFDGSDILSDITIENFDY